MEGIIDLRLKPDDNEHLYLHKQLIKVAMLRIVLEIQYFPSYTYCHPANTKH